MSKCVIKLSGGLGNQLFQYAFAKNLELTYKNNVLLDLCFYKNDLKRSFGLEVFKVNYREANLAEINVAKTSGESIPRFFLRIYTFLMNDVFFATFIPFFLKEYKKNTYLSGYWQSENYFKNIEKLIRNQIVLKNESDNFIDFKDKIKAGNFISAHIRRTDYLGVKCFSNIITSEYIHKAITYIDKETGEQYPLVIFSDDVTWCKKNLNVKNRLIIYPSDMNLKDYEELILMSYCKHNIISNSTFSWWGAWLNENNDKIVVAPKKWSRCLHQSFNHIIPQQWIRL